MSSLLTLALPRGVARLIKGFEDELIFANGQLACKAAAFGREVVDGPGSEILTHAKNWEKSARMSMDLVELSKLAHR